MTGAIAQILTSTLLALHTFIGNWGASIIALTLLVRAAIWPLSKAQVEGMKRLQAVAPLVKELEVKYKDDPEKKGQETLKLYAEHKVNPLSSCLPLLIQMPIMIGMFIALRDPRFTKQLPGFDTASFLGMRLMVKPLEANPFPEIERLSGMVDLASLLQIGFLYDRFIYLPSLPLFILYGVTTIVYSKQMQAGSTSTDPNQKLMSNMMMPMFLYFGLIFPNGLLLYFVITNIIQMVQQKLAGTPSKTPPSDGTATAEIMPPPSGKAGGNHKVAKVVRREPEIVDVVPE